MPVSLQPKVAVNKKQHSGSTVKIIFKPARPAPDQRLAKSSIWTRIFYKNKTTLKQPPTKRQRGQKVAFFKIRNHFEDILRSIHHKDTPKNGSILGFRNPQIGPRLGYFIRQVKQGAWYILEKQPKGVLF